MRILSNFFVTSCCKFVASAHQRISASAHQRISASAHQRISASAHQRISASAHQRISNNHDAIIFFNVCSRTGTVQFDCHSA
jgi:hypothetical protein